VWRLTERSDLENLLLVIGFVFCSAIAAYALRVYPRIASRLTDSLPREGIARKFIIWPYRDMRYDSPEALQNARGAGIGSVLFAGYCLIQLIWNVGHALVNIVQRSHSSG
jgi:hypothetical protein